MYGNYAHADENEDNSQSGSFNVQSLLGTTRKYERRLGKMPGVKPVRMDQSSRKADGAGGARRMLVARQAHKTSGTTERSEQQQQEEDDEEEGQVVQMQVKRTLKLSPCRTFDDDADYSEQKKSSSQSRVNVSDLYLADAFKPLSLEPSYPPSVTRTSKENSPDSGSFTASTEQLCPNQLKAAAVSGDFTDMLPVRHGRKASGVSRPQPIRMAAASHAMPARTPSGARETETSSSGLVHTSDAIHPAGGLASSHEPLHHILANEDEHRTHEEFHSVDKRPRGVTGKENVPVFKLNDHKLEASRNTGHVSFSHQKYNSSIHDRLSALVASGTTPGLCRSKSAGPAAMSHLLETPVSQPSLPRPPARPELKKSVTLAAPHSLGRPARNSETVLVVHNRRYKVMKLLGTGGSSRVYEAFDEDRKCVVAIKKVDLSEADEAQAWGYINEIDMLKRLQGEDRIVKLFDHEQVDSECLLYVVMERGDTDLSNLLKRCAANKEITPAMIKHYWTEMLLAVRVIHKHGIIHSDLKPANFLLVAGRLKLIDFGIASAVQSDKTSVVKDTQMGTFNFMSPEAIQDAAGGPQDGKVCIKISTKSDVWSLGCILYNLTYGKMPFGDIKHPLLKLQAIVNPDHKISFPMEGHDPLLIDILTSCLVRDPKARPSIEQLLDHSYLKEASQAPEPQAEQKLDPLNAVKLLATLEGVLSPATLSKTKKGLTAALEQGGGAKFDANVIKKMNL